MDELNKPQPRLDYVKGILETLIEGFSNEDLPTIKNIVPGMVRAIEPLPPEATDFGVKTRVDHIQKAEII